MATAARGGNGTEGLLWVTAADAAPLGDTTTLAMTRSNQYWGLRHRSRLAICGDDERMRIVQNKATNSFGDAFQGVFCQRFFPSENALAGN